MKQTLFWFVALLSFISSCAFFNTVSAQLKVQAGKSYINISKPAGGVIENGDELEIRAVLSVSGSSVYFARYNDTVPGGTTYISNSIRFSTNEGLVYGTPLRANGLLTDAGGDDEAVYSSGIIRINLGSLTRTGGQTSPYNAVAASTPIDVLPAASGCRIYNTGRPSNFGSTCILMVTYRVYVNTTAGSTFNIPGGAFRYKTSNTSNETTLPSIVKALNKMTVMVSASLPVCSSVGNNSIEGNGGNFGSGTTQNLNPAPSAGTVVPGYQWQPFTSGSGPNDSMFTVANNTSTDGSINSSLPYPSSPSRLFGLWDIIGDHTNAADPLLGNAPTTPGQTGGYMAVVNAAYGINNAVQQTVNGLCPDTYYEFSAWFRNICRRCSCDSSGKGSGTTGFKSYLSPVVPGTIDSAGVTPNLTFQIDGVDHYTTGNIDYSGQWVKKGFLYKTGASQTSLNIVIRNNAPGGGGNDWVMDDVMFATCLPGLEMKPTLNPTYCANSQVDISVVVQTFYNNYSYYQWEVSADSGATWNNAPLALTPQTLNYNYVAPNYIDTVHYPSFIATTGINGYKYRIRVATSLSNLSNTSCAVYNTTDVITINVPPACVILPAEVVNLKAEAKDNRTVISWAAKNEEQVLCYDVERSEDGVLFKKIGTVYSQQNGLNENGYLFNDEALPVNKMYYRLKMIASTGSYKMSNIVELYTGSKNKLEVLSVVNPFNQDLRFVVSNNKNEKIEIILKETTGRTLLAREINVAAGYNTVLLNIPANLQTGMYILQVKSSDVVINKFVQKR